MNSRRIFRFSIDNRQLLVGAFMVLTLTVTAQKSIYAADWGVESSSSLQLEYNDNKRLTDGPHDPVFGSILNVQGALKGQTETTSVSVAPRYRIDRFKGEENLNSETAYVDTNLLHTTERTLSQLAISYTRDTPLTSEVQQNEVVLTNKIRNRWSVSPFWRYQLDARNTINFGAAYLKVKHKDAELTGLVDYKYSSAFSQYSILLSEVSKLSAKIYGSRLDAKSVRYQTDDGGVDLSLDSQLSQSKKYSIHFGWHQVTLNSGVDAAKIQDTQSGTLLGISYNRQFEKSNLVFSVDKTIEPSGVGVLVENLTGSVTLNKHLSENVRNSLYISSSSNKSVADRGTYNKWESRQLLWRVVIKLNKYWAFDSSYRYKWQKVFAYQKAAQSNALIFTLSYRGF